VHHLYTHTSTYIVGLDTEEHGSQTPIFPAGSTEEEEKGCGELEMDKTLVIVCSVIGSLGVLSAILGFSAEGTKLTVSTTADLPS